MFYTFPLKIRDTHQSLKKSSTFPSKQNPSLTLSSSLCVHNHQARGGLVGVPTSLQVEGYELEEYQAVAHRNTWKQSRNRSHHLYGSVCKLGYVHSVSIEQMLMAAYHQRNTSHSSSTNFSVDFSLFFFLKVPDCTQELWKPRICPLVQTRHYAVELMRVPVIF